MRRTRPCVERLEIERRPRGLVSRKPSELERRAKEPHRLLRAAELVREIARPREPQRAEPRIGGEPGSPLQRRERDVQAAANRARSAAASSAAATSSSGPRAAAARCQTARSGSPASVRASAACASRRCSPVAA